MSRPAAVREHGTRRRYHSGPDENGSPGPCRCQPCRAANTDAEARRKLRIRIGAPGRFTAAGPARAHALKLRRDGIGWRQAERLAGVPTGTVHRLLFKGVTVISRASARAILAVRTPSAADGALVDAGEARGQLRALTACGWSQSLLATPLGMEARNVGRLLGAVKVRAATARAVAALYAELCDQEPPEQTPAQRQAAARARNSAIRNGWHRPQRAAALAGGLDDVGPWESPFAAPPQWRAEYDREEADARWLDAAAPREANVVHGMAAARDSLDRVLERHAAARREGAAA